MCRKPLVKDCEVQGEPVCRTVYESECWTKQHEHAVRWSFYFPLVAFYLFFSSVFRSTAFDFSSYKWYQLIHEFPLFFSLIFFFSLQNKPIVQFSFPTLCLSLNIITYVSPWPTNTAYNFTRFKTFIPIPLLYILSPYLSRSPILTHRCVQVTDDVAECVTVIDEKCEDETVGYTTQTKCHKWPR